MYMLKYQQIAIDIEKYIEEHQLQQGDKLPVLQTLMTRFNVSKSTITKSLDLLEKRDCVSSEGSGILSDGIKEKGISVCFLIRDLKNHLKILMSLPNY